MFGGIEINLSFIISVESFVFSERSMRSISQRLCTTTLPLRYFCSVQRAVSLHPPASISAGSQRYPDSWVHFTPEEFIGKTGGEIVHEMLKRHKVKHVFGYPGGAILPVFDAIYESKHFEFILPRHEQGAGHMAEGYARVTGKPGIVIVTSGPGATNTITPLQDALCDGTPMIVFSGQVPTSAIGTDAFQEADIVGISRFCTKWNILVDNIAMLPLRINEAFFVATSGRPGPVLVDLPKDVTAGKLQKPAYTKSSIASLRKRVFEIEEHHTGTVAKVENRVVELINQSKRPVIYAGQGVISSNASNILKEFAKKANIPVTTTLQGLGAFNELDPLSLHMLGMHGSAYANYAMQRADLILAIGARFDDRVTGYVPKFAPEARKAEAEGRGGIVHFDIMKKNMNKVLSSTLQVVGDCGQNMQKIIPRLVHRERANWMSELVELKRQHPFRYIESKEGDRLKPQRIIEELDLQTRHIKDKVIITTGVGQHQMWAAQFYRWTAPRSFVTSGGLGTMGFGLPAAIGAQVAKPDHIVVDIDGDGSFSMTAMELATAAEFNIPVKVLLLNNDFQGMVKQWQDLFYEERYSGTVMKNPDFVKLAQAMHCHALRVSKEEDVADAVAEFLACKGPVLLDAVVDAAEHVYPMVPAGKGLDEMVLGDCTLPE